jgi:hypothetical protein
MVKLSHLGLNPKFNIGVAFTVNYSFSGDNILIDSKTLFVTDFVNLKIKSVQSFEVAHRSRVYVRMFIGVSAYNCMSICVCTVFLKK